MHLKFRNCNDAFRDLVSGIHTGRIPTNVGPSRVGEVMSIEEPVIITYSHPRERVLFNAQRDANPFFHVFESLHMLAGRRDIASLEYYAANYAKQVRDGDNTDANGAYGYRWRNHHVAGIDVLTKSASYEGVVDQLLGIIDHLRRKPESRRVVLSMWNVEDDLLKMDTSKDVCCNLCVKFRVINGDCKDCNGKGYISNEPSAPACYTCSGTPHDQPRYLNMTVFNRSNDLIWGSLGANVVHFSFLQEYLACALGLEVGEYHQISDDLHTYTERWHPEAWLQSHDTNYYAVDREDQTVNGGVLPGTQLLRDVKVFDEEVKRFIDDFSQDWREPFLNGTAKPMCQAFMHHKARHYDLAREALTRVRSADWQAAGYAWIARREHNWQKNENFASAYGGKREDSTIT